MGHDTLMLGVDAGGTATRAVLTTPRGDCIGYGLGGRGNPISAGPERAADGVLDAISGALSASASALSEVAVITAAMAGHSTTGGEGDGEWLRARLAAQGFTGTLTFESDLAATYFSGAAEHFGYAIVAGTGACVIRIADGRIDTTIDGLGWLLGDRGSGFWIGRRVAKAVVRHLDGSGPATALTSRLLEHLGIGSGNDRETGPGQDRELTPGEHRSDGRPDALQRLITSLYARPPIELAALAPLAFGLQDVVAERILRRAGAHLADSLIAALAGPGPLVVGGGVLARTGPVRDAFAQRLGAAAADLELRPVVDGSVGAAVLALRAAGAEVSPEMLGRLSESLARFR